MALLDGAISFWDGSDAAGASAFDSWGSNHLPAFNSPGASGGFRDLEHDSEQYFSLADNPTFELNPRGEAGGGNFTYAGWFRLESATTAWLLSKDEGVDDFEYEFFYYNDAPQKLVFGVSHDGVSPNQLVGTTTISVDTLYFFVIWHDADADNINLQVNNGSPDSQAHTTGIFSGNAPIYVGTTGGGPGASWDGTFGKLLFTHKILTAEERLWLYNGGTPRTLAEMVEYSYPSPRIYVGL